MKIAVYLGSSFGNKAAYRQAARETGEWIANHGHTLVYGGSRLGLMGELARSCKMHGGSVIGVQPEMFLEERQETMVDEIIVTKTLSERRLRMMELADVFVALPGGMGTLDELSEVLTNMQLHLKKGKLFLLNTEGYYESLRRLLETMVYEGFYAPQNVKDVHFVDTIGEVEEWI